MGGFSRGVITRVQLVLRLQMRGGKSPRILKTFSFADEFFGYLRVQSYIKILLQLSPWS